MIDNLEKWSDGIKLFENGDLKLALEIFTKLDDQAKCSFNVGMIYCKIGYYHSAVSAFKKSISSDIYLGAAYFQSGYSFMMLSEFELAKKSFLSCLDLLKKNDWIDYEQLGLSFKLYRCEILFNLAVCSSQTGDMKRASKYLHEAKRLISTPEQYVVIVIEYFHRRRAIPFSIPSSSIFKIPESKLKNLNRREFLKEAKVVVDTDEFSSSKFAGFTGAMILNPVLDWESGVTTLIREKIVAPKNTKALRKSFTLPLSKQVKAAAKMLTNSLQKSNQPENVIISQNTTFEEHKTLEQTVKTAYLSEVVDSSETLKPRKAQINARKSSLSKKHPPAISDIPPVPKLEVGRLLGNSKQLNSEKAPDSEFQDLNRGTTVDHHRLDVQKGHHLREISTPVKIVLHYGYNVTHAFSSDRNITFESFQKLVGKELNTVNPVHICFEDEEDLISIVDQDDLALAFDNTLDLVHLYIRGAP